MLPQRELNACALERPEVKAEHTGLEEFLRARAAAGITQAAVATRIGTTQSAIARLESGGGNLVVSVAEFLHKCLHIAW